MTTVRERRVQAVMKVIEKQIKLERIGYVEDDKKKGKLWRRAAIEICAEDIIDELFPDHTLDNVDIGPTYE